MGQQATGVADIQKERIGRRKGEEEGQKESKSINLQHQIKELGCLSELEVNQLSDGLQVVILDVLLWLHENDTCQGLVVEDDIVEYTLLVSSDLLSDYHLLEINGAVLHFNAPA